MWGRPSHAMRATDKERWLRDHEYTQLVWQLVDFWPIHTIEATALSLAVATKSLVFQEFIMLPRGCAGRRLYVPRKRRFARQQVFASGYYIV